jgi:hypothetical protein
MTTSPRRYRTCLPDDALCKEAWLVYLGLEMLVFTFQGQRGDVGIAPYEDVAAL